MNTHTHTHTHKHAVFCVCREVLDQLWGMQWVSQFLRVSGMNGTSLNPPGPMWLCYSRRQADIKCPATVLEKAWGTGKMLNEAESLVYIKSLIKSVLKFPLRASVSRMKFTWDVWKVCNLAAESPKGHSFFNPTADRSITDGLINCFI